MSRWGTKEPVHSSNPTEIPVRVQSEMRSTIGIDRIVSDTDGLSFAEMEELRTQLVFHYLDHEVWDWRVARSRLLQRASVATAPTPIGFGWADSDQLVAAPNVKASRL